MAWLDPGEGISHLLRGAYGGDAPPPPQKSEALFDLLLLFVICALLAIVIVGAIHLWHRFAIGNAAVVVLAELLRLQRRIGVAAKNFRARIEQEIEKKDRLLHR
jgi:hypothetical protein